MMPSPSIKFDHGSVPAIMPILPNNVLTKLIIDEAEPTFSLTVFSKIFMQSGRATAPITVNGRNDVKKPIALQCPAVKINAPLIIGTIKHSRIIAPSEMKFFNRK